MEGCFTFQWGAGRVFVFQMSVRPVMGIGFNEGVSEKKFRMGGALPPCPPPPHYGKPYTGCWFFLIEYPTCKYTL